MPRKRHWLKGLSQSYAKRMCCLRRDKRAQNR